MNVTLPAIHPLRPGEHVQWNKYHVPPGYVVVEYIGDQSPFDDPWVTVRISLGKYTKDDVAVMREMAGRAVKPWLNNARVLTQKDVPGGLSRPYRFGTGKQGLRVAPCQPGSFFQLVTNRDADLIKSSDSGYQFRIHPWEPPPIIQQPNDIRIVRKDDFRNYKIRKVY